MSRLIDISGNTYERWFVLARGENKGGKPGWICRCSCGEIKTIKGSNLKTGNSGSCGCLLREVSRRLLSKHGLSRTPTWLSWMLIKSRVKRKRAYRDLGIAVEWRDSFLAFLRDMGEKPVGMTIDRLDNSKGYFPGNCRWATPREQTENRRNTRWVEFRGERKTIKQWAEETGVSYGTLFQRLEEDWPLERALSGPLKHGRHRPKDPTH